MTIGIAGARVSLNCDGASKVFPVPIQAYEPDDLTVVLTAPSVLGGAQTILTLNSDYSLAPSGTLEPAQWTLTTLAFAAYAAGFELQVFIDPVQEQQTQYIQGQAFPSLAVQTNFDRLTQMAQRLQDQVNRAVRAPDGDATPGMLLAPAMQRALKYLAFDANGNAAMAASLPGSNVTQASLGPILNPQTSAESTAVPPVIPTNYAYPFGDLRRYGGDPTGAADSSAAFAQAVSVGLVVIPQGCSYKILTPAAKTGQVTILGAGPSSKLLSDGNILTVTNGTGSILDNFWMENLTAPYVITRNPASWATPVTTAVQSNTVLGYQPTINDPEYATLYGIYGAALAATISPTITFTGNASDVLISRIYGRFVYLNLQDLADSMVCDCDFRGGRGPVSPGSGGGGGPYGCVVFDNVTNSLQAGDRNRALRNKISYASFSGLVAIGNFDGLMQHNVVTRCGESGLKVNHGDTKSSQRMHLLGNSCTHNYFDGIDADSSSPASDAQATFHIISGNRSYRNGGAGINIDGQYNVVSGNHIYLNYRYGLWALCSYSSIVGNECVGNNLGNDASTADLLGGSQGNVIASNVVHFTASAGYPIYAAQMGIPHQVYGNYTTGGTNFFGNVGAIVPVVDNNLDATGPGVTPQCFSLTIANNAGTLQASFSADAGTVNGGNFGSRVIGAGFQIAIPTGTDATTAMAGGGKIGSANSNRFWLNTAPQNNLNSYGVAVIGNNTSTTAVIVRYAVASININGTNIARPYFEFFNATTGAAFALTTANIGSGTNLQVQFLGKLA